MSWLIGYDSHWNRDIGYVVPAECDHPGCHAQIGRGLAYVCGGEPEGGELGCSLFFCEEHLWFTAPRPEYSESPPSHAEEIAWHEIHDNSDKGAFMCECCCAWHESDAPVQMHFFEPTPDVEEWLYHKATDPSWAEWREREGIPS